MDKNKLAQGLYSALETGIVALIVAAGGAAILFTDFSGQGRLWDTLQARLSGEQAFEKAPNVGVVKTQVAEEAGNRMLVVNSAEPETPLAEAPKAAAAIPAPRKKEWKKGLEGSLNFFDPRSPATSRTSASAQAVNNIPAAPAAPSYEPAAAAAAPARSNKVAAGAAQASRASYVHYGGATRSDIMGGGAGPVYNIMGKKKDR